MQRKFFDHDHPDHDIVIYVDDLNNVYVGDSFEVKARISNLSDTSRTITMHVTLLSTHYTGKRNDVLSGGE